MNKHFLQFSICIVVLVFFKSCSARETDSYCKQKCEDYRNLCVIGFNVSNQANTGNLLLCELYHIECSKPCTVRIFDNKSSSGSGGGSGAGSSSSGGSSGGSGGSSHEIFRNYP